MYTFLFLLNKSKNQNAYYKIHFVFAYFHPDYFAAAVCAASSFFSGSLEESCVLYNYLHSNTHYI